jgi:UPF0271 protein
MRIDLNADVGESLGPWAMGDDEALIPLVTSVNVACGFHAGDPRTIERTVAIAVEAGAAIGAHPGYPDLVGFGRRDMAVAPDDLEAAIVYQVGAVAAFVRAAGAELRHVKAHGALYNTAARDAGIADAIADAVRSVDPQLVMVCLSRSAMVAAAQRAGLRHVEEAFADRAYLADGNLVPRRSPGAVVTDPAAIAERVAAMAKERTVRAIDGGAVALDARTVCVHGDTPGAVQVIRAIRARLAQDGIAVRAFDG